MYSARRRGSAGSQGRLAHRETKDPTHRALALAPAIDASKVEISAQRNIEGARAQHRRPYPFLLLD